MLNRSAAPLRCVRPCVVLAVLTLIVGGCASSGSGAYVSEYQAGQYSAAHRSASAAASAASGAQRDEAALIAGLSAHAMDRPAEAERWLRSLVSNRDRQIAGRASAALGLIELDRRNHERAAALLSQAASQLSGNDAARAGMYAGDAYTALGRPDAARMQYNLAHALTSDATLKRTLIERLDRSGFTIQVGAFSERINAERTAREVKSTSVGYGYGLPRVVESVDERGRALYLVQLGRFTSKAEADTARGRFGRNGIIAAAPTND
ncbi:MAG: SPOR domain-containing protein [Phycisphaeraceae bacterium]|nr:MAG: SPOR domain-containing protein [Phycisphaeraceae bacterium]